MPPFDPIEISDDEGGAAVGAQAILQSPRPIRAFAIVANINVRIEETNSTIQAYKDDVTRLKELLRSAEARLEKEQEKRLKLIEQKSEALNSGVTEINARSGVPIEVKTEVKKELKEEGNLVSRDKPKHRVRQRSIFMGVQIPSRNPSPTVDASTLSRALKIETQNTPVARNQTSPLPSLPPQRISAIPSQDSRDASWHDDESDANMLMGDDDWEDDDFFNNQSPVEVNQSKVSEKVAPETQGNDSLASSQKTTPTLRIRLKVPAQTLSQYPKTRLNVPKLVHTKSAMVKAKVPGPVPTRAKTWRGGGNFGRPSGTQRSSIGIPRISKAFTRMVIRSAIGGQLQHTWPTPLPNHSYAIQVTRYCCLRRELNWCLPSGPGEDTLMFATRPFDWGQADFPLFIREEAPKWKYYGDYKITGCHEILLQEWREFSKIQKITWCKHMLTRGWGKSVLAKHFSERELRSMGSSDWEKVHALFDREDSNPRRLRITARHLEFVRYNRNLYDLLEEKSITHTPIKDLKPLAVEKRKGTNDDDEIGLPDDDYTEQLSSDNEDVPPRKRTRFNRRFALRVEPDSDSEDQSVNETTRVPPSHPVPSPPIPSPPPPTQAAATPRIKEELFGDDEDLYSAPPNAKPPKASRTLVRVHPNGDSERGSSFEMWEVKPEPWVLPTKDNDMIAASDEPFKKFDANQLIRVWKPCVINNLPKFPTTMFSRRFMSKYLGGCEQMQECVISETKRRTQIYDMSVYYCERAEWAPDMPEKPGAHGVVYATKSDKGAVNFNHSTYAVFCRRGANQWEYCGEYQITRRDFIPGEWSRVPPIAKKFWSEGFAGKRGKWGIAHMLSLGIISPGQKVTAQDVLQFIDDGLLQLECQVYKCVGYNREFYDVLEAKWDETMRAGLAMKQEILDDEDS